MNFNLNNYCSLTGFPSRMFFIRMKSFYVTNIVVEMERMFVYECRYMFVAHLCLLWGGKDSFSTRQTYIHA